MILSQKLSLTHAYIRIDQHILPFNIVPEAEMEQGKPDLISWFSIFIEQFMYKKLKYIMHIKYL